MKFELKTENEKYSNLFTHFFKTISILTLIVILCDIALKLGVISKQYQIEYNCKLLSVVKSKPNFKKLSRISNLKNKQIIWELCREVVK